MTTPTNSHPSRSRRIRRTAATTVVAGLILAAGACSSNDDSARTASVASVAGQAPPTTAPPPPTPRAPARTVPPNAAATPAAASPSTAAEPPTTQSETVHATVPVTVPASVPAGQETSTVPPSASSETNTAQRDVLTWILESHRGRGEFVGARIAVLERDGTVTHAVAGTKTIGEPADEVDEDTPWGVGSITKTFVAAVVLQLVDEGRIDLDGGIAHLVPGLAGAERITPRHLLQHTSGLNEYLHHPTVEADTARAWTHSELIAVAESAGRVGEPGGPFHYSNTNYIVLGEIIEQVTGNSVADEVRTRIVEPLGMTDTSFVDGDAAPGYALSGGAFVVPPPRHPSLGASAGAMQSTTSDLLRFAKALADGTLLSDEAQHEMRSFVPGEDLSRFGLVQQYGLGLEAYSNDKVTVVGHMGNGHAYSAFFGYDAERGTAVAVMMNTYNPGAQAFMALETLVALGAR